MTEQQYYKDMADVTVVFTDGTVETFRISAGPTIGGYLAREAGNSGVLSLWNRNRAFGIPLTSIRSWEIAPVPVGDQDQVEQSVAQDEHPT